jgi:hypothetical protein
MEGHLRLPQKLNQSVKIDIDLYSILFPSVSYLIRITYFMLHCSTKIFKITPRVDKRMFWKTKIKKGGKLQLSPMVKKKKLHIDIPLK